MAEDKLVCWKCGVPLDGVPMPIRRHSNCLSCYAELHCCRMCASFDPRLISKCSDERADSPENKESANFCEFFEPKPNAHDFSRDKSADKAKAELEALFGEGEAPEEVPEPKGEEPLSEEEKAKRELERLFGKD